MTVQASTYGASTPVVTDALQAPPSHTMAAGLMKMNTEPVMDVTLKHDPDYRAAWSACRRPNKPDPIAGWYEANLRARLAIALETGWSIAALKVRAYQYRNGLCETPRYDHITPTGWRWAVLLADTDRRFLESYNANA